jgi:RimJ/RimL family protein N-acetyltransferase
VTHDAQLSIRPATLSDADLDGFSRFVVDHCAESGQGGSLVFAFSREVQVAEVRTNAVTRWARALDEPNWGRAYLLAGEGGRVFGHVELKGGRLVAELHRATLGMGILRAYTGQGWGKRLLDAMIRWAKRSADLDWIDLGVFSHNLPARALYRHAGFVEVGVREDAFHIDGVGSVDDIQMALDLRQMK